MSYLQGPEGPAVELLAQAKSSKIIFGVINISIFFLPFLLYQKFNKYKILNLPIRKKGPSLIGL